MVIKCNHILISLFKLKSEAEIACKFQYADFKGSIPYCKLSVKLTQITVVSPRCVTQTCQTVNRHAEKLATKPCRRAAPNRHVM